MSRAPLPPNASAASAPVLVLVLVAVLVPAACRVGPPVADALRAPYPDGAERDLAADGDGSVDGDGPRPPCDLLKQDCPNQQTCYPRDGVPGVTYCEPISGSAPPTTLCVVNADCDVRETCTLVPETQTMMCVSLCDPASVVTGCQRGAPCRLLSGFRAGYCVP
jgi:hypothetical protein